MSDEEDVQIVVGVDVFVESRTWPGINKPGGFGKVTKVNEDGTLDVRYVLGGSEKSVDTQYVHSKSCDEGPRKREKASSSRPSRSPNAKSDLERLLLSIIAKVRQKDTYGLFHEPVDLEEVPDYSAIVRDPIDLRTMQERVDALSITTVTDLKAKLDLMIANSFAYNDSGAFEYQQAQKIDILIKKEIERAFTVETRYIREQERREELERREECTVVMDEIIDMVVKVEEKRLIRVEKERKRLLYKQQMAIGFTSEKLEQADWGQSQLDRFSMFKKQVDRASALEKATLKGSDNPVFKKPTALQAVLPVIAVEKDVTLNTSVGKSNGKGAAPAPKLETVAVDDMKLCFPQIFEKFGFLGVTRVIQVLDSTRLEEEMAAKILDKEVTARRRLMQQNGQEGEPAKTVGEESRPRRADDSDDGGEDSDVEIDETMSAASKEEIAASCKKIDSFFSAKDVATKGQAFVKPGAAKNKKKGMKQGKDENSGSADGMAKFLGSGAAASKQQEAAVIEQQREQKKLQVQKKRAAAKRAAAAEKAEEAKRLAEDKERARNLQAQNDREARATKRRRVEIAA